jgi:voltage-gated cation channel
VSTENKNKFLFVRIVSTTEIWFLAAFTFESFCKIFANGFIFEPHTYLRDSWNWLDFIVIVAGYISYFHVTGQNLNVLRTFRVLR